MLFVATLSVDVAAAVVVVTVLPASVVDVALALEELELLEDEVDDDPPHAARARTNTAPSIITFERLMPSLEVNTPVFY